MKTEHRINHVEISKRAFDESIRIEDMIWLAVSNHQDGLPDMFTDDFMGDPENWKEAFGEPLPDGAKRYDNEQVSELLAGAGRNGFLAKLVSPVPVSADAGGYSSYGWGYVRIFWVYGESPEEIFENAVLKVHAWRKKKLSELLAEEKS